MMNRWMTTMSMAALLAGACNEDGDEGATQGGTSGGSVETSDTDTDASRPMLGATPLQRCDNAVFAWEQIDAELALPATFPDSLRTLYVGDGNGGGELQALVQLADVAAGRVDDGVLRDDAAILAALDGADPVELRAIRDHVRSAVFAHMKVLLSEVSVAGPDADRDPALLYARWDEAYCEFDGFLRPLTQQAQASSSSPADEPWEEAVEEGFLLGHEGIEGPDAPWAPDPFAVKPARQIIEKLLYTVAQRLVVAYGTTAQTQQDPLAAEQALAALSLIEDRLEGRNTPGLERVRMALRGDPAAIDPAQLQRELDIAFVKRARKYCDEAVLTGLVGNAEGLKGAYEGIIYTRLVLPGMQAETGVDVAQQIADWERFVTAVEQGDTETAVAVSESLVADNCAYQAALGIASCTATEDEP